MSSIEEEWSLDPKGLHESHWVDVIFNSYENGEHWMRAAVKWDGCIHLNKAYNSPFPQKDDDEHQDYIHICDLREYIEQLQKLEKFATEYFKNDNEYWGKE